MAQIFVSGTWRTEKAAPYADMAERLGAELAQRGFDLACGPGTGIARHAIDGYRAVSSRGTVRFYLPLEQLMIDVGETVGAGFDEIEQTEFDYPMRNVWQVSKCDGLVVLTGGDGALEEVLPALIDYRIPVGVIRGSGPAAAAVERLLDLFPEWKDLLIFADDIDPIVKAFEERITLETPRI